MTVSHPPAARPARRKIHLQKVDASVVLVLAAVIIETRFRVDLQIGLAFLGLATVWISLTLETSSSRVSSGSRASPANPRCRQSARPARPWWVLFPAP